MFSAFRVDGNWKEYFKERKMNKVESAIKSELKITAKHEEKRKLANAKIFVIYVNSKTTNIIEK